MKNITMRLFELYFVVAFIAFTYSSAIPKQAEHKDRVHESKLSDANHNADGEHNNDYDHDAFLGKDEAKTFDQLSPEESKERLGIIVEKIDKDKDGKITEEELKNWIQIVQKRYITTDTERMWKDHKVEGDQLTWNSYKKRTYGFTDESEVEDPETSKDMIERDDRRWKAADQNNDGYLDKEEFANFLHPEEAEHMKDIVVKETMEDIDKNKDNLISLEEYIGDMWPNSEGEEPQWVKDEREQFNSYRDKNSDGQMDHEEVKQWIIPPDYDHTEAEAKHLIYESDTDKDGILSKAEILEHYDTFVGSQATDFGEVLVKHDEF